MSAVDTQNILLTQAKEALGHPVCAERKTHGGGRHKGQAVIDGVMGVVHPGKTDLVWIRIIAMPTGSATQALCVTVSIGVSSCTGPATLDEVLKRADAALYQAKHSGRNQVRVDAQTP